MINYFLAFVLLGALGESAPEMHSPHKTFEDCATARIAAIKEHEALLKQPAVIAAGGTFVCLKLVSTT